MRGAFYPKLAAAGIRKNNRMYLPYILTCTGMVMMSYIIAFLQSSDTLMNMRGGDEVSVFLGFGGWVIAVFACIFLFYTNSFLIRRRKKEFGLYNILGMGKRNIGRILFWEALIIAVLSLDIGLLAGIALSKLAELGLVNIMGGDVNYTLSVSLPAIKMTVMVYGAIFVLLFLNSLCQIKFSSAISLIRSENVGEKPPKGNWFFGILGVLILGAAYYISVTIEDPISALGWFFVAVLMVIVGTYMLMIAGSVLFCRILQKKKSYYYRSNHFVSVSSMVYRMKRNGAGLASICILATMVLVMISSTTSLYFGSEDSLNNRYPRDINMDYRMETIEELSSENVAALRQYILSVVNEYGIDPTNCYDYRSAVISGFLGGHNVEVDVTKFEQLSLDMYSNIFQFTFVPIEEYNSLMGANETLENGEAILYTYRTTYTEDTLSFNNGNTFHIKKTVDDFITSGDAAMNIVPTMVIFVPDLAEAIEGIDKLTDFNGDGMISLRWTYDFDTGLSKDKQIELYDELGQRFADPDLSDEYTFHSCLIESREVNRDDFYADFGGLFYLGIILSVVFIFAAVLIIYYKQISEGYEDQARFEIMQKVGMTKREIRKSINSQLLTVFFLPLIGVGLHLAFAFPIIRKLLLLFNLNNVWLFAATTVISFLVFALLYTLVYRLTSNAYYNIVSGAREGN